MRKLIFGIPSHYTTTAEKPVWRPAVESFKAADGYFVRMDLPGVDPKNVEISVEDNILMVSGAREKKVESSHANEWYGEAAFGQFHRRFELPKGVDSNKIQASYEHGVLEIKIPLVVKPAARKIAVTVGDSSTTATQAA